MEILILKGIPASGKSTYAKKLVDTGRYKRSNKDDLRAMIDNSHWNKKNERFVLAIRDSFINECIKNDINCIIDDTNFDNKHFKNICDLARYANKNIIVKEVYFPIEVEEAIERNKKRIAEGTTLVTEKVIRDMYERWVKGRKIEEKVEVFTKRIEVQRKVTTLPKALIIDLDGTCCIHNGRNPYETEKCETDLPNKGVIETVLLYYKQGYKILFVSGREDKYREQTENWLKNHVLVEHSEFVRIEDDGRYDIDMKMVPINYELHMRPSGDMRSDVIIKAEIYKAHIEDKYEVLFAIDDRNRIVKLWRDLGILCFQCADGNF